ncbi:MAG: FAD-binding oxidoreductase [Pseudomonadota bacterium]
MSIHTDEICDVTIVGAGIVGICCALSIAEKGLSVQLIDRDKPGQGTSYGNAGVISPWSIVPQAVPGIWKQIPSMLLKSDGPLAIKTSYLPKFIPWGIRFLRNISEKKVLQSAEAMEFLNHSNVELYRQHLSGTGHEYLIRDSYYVHAFRNPNKVDINSLGYSIRSQKGGDLERIGESELHELEPALSSSFKAAILIKGQARASSPGKIGAVLAGKAQALGVKIITADVETISPDKANNWEVTTSAGKFVSGKLVISAGAWSMKLLQPLGISLPLEAERGYHLEYDDPGVELNNSVMDAERMFVASSMEDGLRVAGTAEFAGLETPPNEKRIKSLNKLAKNMLPDLNTKSFKTWMGIRPSMPDSLPVIDEFKSHKGLFAAFGHSHYGLMMAPKTGQIISDLVADTPINHDLSALSSERF